MPRFGVVRRPTDGSAGRRLACREAGVQFASAATQASSVAVKTPSHGAAGTHGCCGFVRLCCGELGFREFLSETHAPFSGIRARRQCSLHRLRLSDSLRPVVVLHATMLPVNIVRLRQELGMARPRPNVIVEA